MPPGAHSARDNHVLASNFANIHRFLFFFTDTLSNITVLISLLTTPPNLKYAARPLGYLVIYPLVACFLTISQVEWKHDERRGGIFNKHFTANLRRNLPVIKFESRLRFDGMTTTSFWPPFYWPTPGP